MGTRSREVIWSSRISGAKMSAEHARQRAMEAAREADRAEAYACRCGWKAMAARRSRRRRSRNA
jgi:hypothetical protein